MNVNPTSVFDQDADSVTGGLEASGARPDPSAGSDQEARPRDPSAVPIDVETSAPLIVDEGEPKEGDAFAPVETQVMEALSMLAQGGHQYEMPKTTEPEPTEPQASIQRDARRTA